MGIRDNIFEYYNSIGCEIKDFFGEEILLRYEKHFSNRPLYFTIVMDVIIPSNREDIDYGLTLSTNAQKFSGMGTSVPYDSELYLVADICLGDGTILISSEEILYNYLDKASMNDAFNTLKSFYSKVTSFIKSELIERYGLKNK